MSDKKGRRAFDLFVAIAGLIFLLPLFALIAVLIKVTDGGPVFYSALRVGKAGREFRLYKFRTMRVGADKDGPGITSKNDTRITRVGSWLRRLKADELPQLINVLRGEMAIVGPRPEDPRYVELYTKRQRRILAFRPGITSAASLHYSQEATLLSGESWHEAYVEDVMPAKLETDLAYLENRSHFSDLKLILQTVKKSFLELAGFVDSPKT